MGLGLRDLERVLAAFPDAALAVDRAGRIAAVNPEAEALFGWSAKELAGQTVEVLLPRAFRDRHEAERARYGRGPYHRPMGRSGLQLAGLRKDGTEMAVDVSLAPLETDDGPLVVASVRDLTERRKSDLDREGLLQQLEQERRWLDTVLQCPPVGVILMDGDGLSVVNRYAASLLPEGVPVDDYRPFGRYAHRENGKPVPDRDLPGVRALRGEVIDREDLLVRFPDGRELTLLVSAAPMRDGVGRILGAVVAFMDITVIRNLQQAREEWISIVAHDLRQPLNHLQIAADMLHAGKIKDLPQSVDRMRDSIRWLDRMVTDLLDASLLEADRMQVCRERVDVVQIVRDVVDRLQPGSAGGDATDVRILSDAREAYALADPGRLGQVVGNLVSNALKYRFEGTVVRVRIEEGGGQLHLSVANDGEGIPPDELGRLFHRFGRTRRAREGHVKGIGLGLYIAKGLVEAHGGRLWAESAPNATTTFHLTLPALER